jgi:hypothetical protein
MDGHGHAGREYRSAEWIQRTDSRHAASDRWTHGGAGHCERSESLAYGKTHHRREYGRALEAIKDTNLQPPDYHDHQILDSGDVIDHANGEVLGNFLDEL